MKSPSGLAGGSIRRAEPDGAAADRGGPAFGLDCKAWLGYSLALTGDPDALDVLDAGKLNAVRKQFVEDMTVLGGLDDLPALVDEREIERVIVAFSGAPEPRMVETLRGLAARGVLVLEKAQERRAVAAVEGGEPGAKLTLGPCRGRRRLRRGRQGEHRQKRREQEGPGLHLLRAGPFVSTR